MEFFENKKIKFMKRKQSETKENIFILRQISLFFQCLNCINNYFFVFFSKIKNSNYATLRPFHSFSSNLTTMSENKKIYSI